MSHRKDPIRCYPPPPSQNEARSDDNESITGISLSDCFMSYQDTRCGVLPFYREAVGVFYCPSWLSKGVNGLIPTMMPVGYTQLFPPEEASFLVHQNLLSLSYKKSVNRSTSIKLYESPKLKKKMKNRLPFSVSEYVNVTFFEPV